MHALRAFLCYMAVIVILVAFHGYIYTNIYYIPYMYGCMNVWASYMVAYVAAAAA